MAYPTVPHQWLEQFGAVPSGGRALWFRNLADRAGVLDSPVGWDERVQAWSQGLVLAVGRSSRNAHAEPDDLKGSADGARQLPPAGEHLLQPDALGLIMVGSDRVAWAYSHRAIWSAGLAVAAFGIRRIWGAPQTIAWWNDWPWSRAGVEFVPAPSAIAGCIAFSDGRRVVYWHPSILGPLILEEEGNVSLAPELTGTVDRNGRLRVRGEAVPMGRWNESEVVPVSYPGGWWLGAHATRDEEQCH